MSTTPSIDLVISRMSAAGSKPAMFWKGEEITYSDFMNMVRSWDKRLHEDNVKAGTVCAYIGDYTPEICAFMFALLKIKAILVPLTTEVVSDIDSFLDIAGAQLFYRFDVDKDIIVESRKKIIEQELIKEFRKQNRPGLVVFTSGSTGKPKAILQDCEQVMKKFVDIRSSWRTVLFLLMDHFGGFNTFLSTFAYLGVAVCPEKRTPEAVAKVIEESRADLLPTTPTFLNLMIASNVHKSYDLSSIKLITYGTELMSKTTLEKVSAIFPLSKLKQTYGLSELGVLRSKSESEDSVWVKVGGAGFETKVIDGILWIRSEANMIGYLNAPSPFDDEGWMCTGDQVEVQGDYIRFLGRKSEIINVGGKKVFPIEVETVLLEDDNIHSATVYAVSHPIMGQVPNARISLNTDEKKEELVERLRKYCNERLAKYKVPVRFYVVKIEEDSNMRFKKVRNIANTNLMN